MWMALGGRWPSTRRRVLHSSMAEHAPDLESITARVERLEEHAMYTGQAVDETQKQMAELLARMQSLALRVTQLQERIERWGSAESRVRAAPTEVEPPEEG